MQLRLLTGGSLLAAIVLMGAACAGTIADEEQFGEVIGAQAELVQKKREWLSGYDRHCGVCFEAFKLCEKGAAELADGANCEAALDACVRGGLISEGDAGAVIADAGSGNAQADAAQSNDVDASVDAGDVLIADAGRPPVFPAVDAGRLPTGTRDSGALLEDAGQSIEPVSDAGGRVRPVFGTGDKAQIAQSVGACLAQSHDCLAAAGSAQSCVGSLRTCVRSALEQALADVCSTQLASCRAEGATANATRSVERLCRSDLDFATDPN